MAVRCVVVCCPNWVGDAVMATPSFECLRAGYAEATMVAWTRPYTRGVVEDSPWFDRIIEGRDKTFRGFWRLVLDLRRLQPEVAVVLPNSIRSALIARLGGARRIYGYRRSGRSLLMSGGPRPPTEDGRILPVPMVDYYLTICRWLGLTVPTAPRPRLFISEARQHETDRLLARYGITPQTMVIGINPGARFGSSKCWPPEYFARLAEMLSARQSCRILLLSGPGETDLSRRIVQESRAVIIDTGPDHVDLNLLKPLIKRCQLLVTNDTGPRHYAVAFEVPVVVIMGPTDPRYTAANLEKTVVVRQETDCAPCHRKTCHDDHRCMRLLTPERVMTACEEVLKDPALP
jgi:heptosyltransferase-2